MNIKYFFIVFVTLVLLVLLWVVLYKALNKKLTPDCDGVACDSLCGCATNEACVDNKCVRQTKAA